MQNDTLAKGYHRNVDKLVIKEKWNEIKTKLNSVGPPARETDGWMKVWADLKTSVKKKLVYNKAESRATGGGSFKQKCLTPLEESVAGILQMDSIINPEGLSFGILNEPATHVENHAEDGNSNASEENELPSCSSRSDVHRSGVNRSRNCKSVQKASLLEEQVKVQIDLYTSIKKRLSEIERYSRKTYKLKEEKLKLKYEKLRMYKEEIKKKIYTDQKS